MRTVNRPNIISVQLVFQAHRVAVLQVRLVGLLAVALRDAADAPTALVQIMELLVIIRVMNIRLQILLAVLNGR